MHVDKVVFQEKFHYVHIGQNLRWIFDALADRESNQYQQGSDIVTRSTEWLTESETKSSVLWESFSFHIHEQFFFFIFWNEQGKQALYMHTSVNTYALKCMQISLLRAAPFISWQWVLVKICGEKLLAFFVNNYYTCLERKNISWSVSVNKSSI